ncbi:MAG: VanZ family protein [Lachnospiraceae bacterium]|nr:VanZ family protein [Lachnospiraceae bacterium]
MKKLFRYLWLFIKTVLRLVLKPLSFLPAIFMMYFIFSMSAQTGDESGSLSLKVSTAIVKVANEVLDENWTPEQVLNKAEEYHHIVRKLAHFTEYFVLAITVAFPLYVYGLRGFPLVIIAGLFCVGFAALDEYHQSFVAGRGPSKKDVIIDSCGAFLGIYVTRFFSFIGRKTIFAPLAKDRD